MFHWAVTLMESIWRSDAVTTPTTLALAVRPVKSGGDSHGRFAANSLPPLHIPRIQRKNMQWVPGSQGRSEWIVGNSEIEFSANPLSDKSRKIRSVQQAKRRRLHLISVHYRLEYPPEDVLLRVRLGTAQARCAALQGNECLRAILVRQTERNQLWISRLRETWAPRKGTSVRSVLGRKFRR